MPLLGNIYRKHRHRRLVEPFVGGMNVALALNPDRAMLADENPHLINFYEHLRRGLVITLEMRNDEALYYRHREAFNGLIEAGCLHEVEMAELFYFLNRAGFNGLCRFSKAGFFNVPFGKYETINFRTDFTEYRDTLARWTPTRCDFEFLWRWSDGVQSDDFIFADPPYDGTFSDYSAGGFTWEQQVSLAKLLSAHRGPVIATNNATPRVVELYRGLGFQVDLLPAPRSISADGNRDAAMEIFATRNLEDIDLDGIATRNLVDKVRAIPVTVTPPRNLGISAERESERQSEYLPERFPERLSQRESEAACESQTADLPNNQDERKKEPEMATLPKDMAEEVGKARVAGGGVYIQHGDYILMIEKWFYQKVQHRVIITEYVVIEAAKKVVFEGDKRVEDEPNPVGSKCSVTVDFDGNGKLSAASNSRAPVLGLFGLKENDVPDSKVTETLQYVCQDVTPAAGMLLRVSTFPKRIRSKEGEFLTGLDYSCVARPMQAGLNAPEMARARMDALARGPEELIKIAAAQLKAARDSGQLGALSEGDGSTTMTSQQTAPIQPGQGAVPQIPQVPAVPSIPVVPVIDPFAGWLQHPQNPEFYYQPGTNNIKSKADLLAAANRS